VMLFIVVQFSWVLIWKLD